MNAGTTAERIYEQLKDLLLSGPIRPGTRLEPARLAGNLSSSVTPVRDALHRLAGEGLVDMRTSDGFHLPLLTEGLLGDLYRWNDELMRIALRRRKRSRSRSGDEVTSSGAAEVFAAIGAATRSEMIKRQIASANAMLAIARRSESSVLSGAEDEIAQIWDAFTVSSSKTRTLVQAYHQKRILQIREIIKSINQPDRTFRI